VPVHGLGIANDLLLNFPLFSTDSIVWVNARKNGTRKLYLDTGEKINAQPDISLLEISRQNIRYLAGLEDSYEKPQVSFGYELSYSLSYKKSRVWGGIQLAPSTIV
jgi:hypothetical protein